MTSEIRANTLKNRVGLGTVSFTDTGPVVSGIVTATSIEVVGAINDDAARIKIPDGMNGAPFTGNLELGNSRDFVMLHDGHHNYVKSTQNMYVFCGGNNLVTLQTGGSVLLNKDLDVDGHTNLDNVSIAGITTFTGYVQTKSELWVGGSAPVLRWRDSTHGEKATARIDGSDLYFEVNNSERLRIDSGGRVTTPTQPMVGCRHFSQNGNNVFNDGNNIYALTFHTVDVNIGSHFNNTTGIFTCPVAGNYFISCNLNLRQNQSSWSSLYVLRKPSGGNFQKLSDNWATSAINNTWAPISASHLVSCGAGDELVMAYNSGYSAPNNSSASGGVSMTIFLFG